VTQYYRLNGGRLSLPECWRLARSWSKFATLLAWKPLGGFPFTFSIPRPESLQIIDPGELPEQVRKWLLEQVALFERAGLELVFSHRSQVLERTRLGVGSVFLDPTGTVIGTVSIAQSSKARRQFAQSFTTHFTDGTAGMSTTARSWFQNQPQYLKNRYGPLPPDVLYMRHQDNLKRWEQRAGKFPQSFTRRQLPDVILQAEQRFVDFHAARGLFVPMTEEEIARKREASDRET
jgi:hypothetical protein